MSRPRHHPQRVESFAPHDSSPPGIHERRAYRIHRPDGSVEEGAYERRFGSSQALFGPAAPSHQLGPGEESFGQLLAGAIEEAVCWLGRVILALLRTAGVMLFLIVGWELSREAGGTGWPGLAVVLIIIGIAGARRREDS